MGNYPAAPHMPDLGVIRTEEREIWVDTLTRIL
jgi:hypothetical protein